MVFLLPIEKGLRIKVQNFALLIPYILPLVVCAIQMQSIEPPQQI